MTPVPKQSVCTWNGLRWSTGGMVCLSAGEASAGGKCREGYKAVRK